METEKHVHYEFQDANWVALRAPRPLILRTKSRLRKSPNDTERSLVISARATGGAPFATVVRARGADDRRLARRHFGRAGSKLCRGFNVARAVLRIRPGPLLTGT